MTHISWLWIQTETKCIPWFFSGVNASCGCDPYCRCLTGSDCFHFQKKMTTKSNQTNDSELVHIVVDILSPSRSNFKPSPRVSVYPVWIICSDMTACWTGLSFSLIKYAYLYTYKISQCLNFQGPGCGQHNYIVLWRSSGIWKVVTLNSVIAELVIFSLLSWDFTYVLNISIPCLCVSSAYIILWPDQWNMIFWRHIFITDPCASWKHGCVPKYLLVRSLRSFQIRYLP
jgi:hypothetical protein